MVNPFDSEALGVLRPGPFPEGMGVELQEVWMGLSALEDRLRGVMASSDREIHPRLLAEAERIQLLRLVARAAVILAVDSGSRGESADV